MPERRKAVTRTPPERGADGGMGGTVISEPSLPPAAWKSHKTRDLFPLPLLQDDAKPRPGLGRKCLRKALVEGHVRAEVNRTIRALNSMYGCPNTGRVFVSLDEEVFGHGAGQLHAINRVVEAVQQVGKPPNDMTCSGAFSSLRAAEGYAEEPSVGALCSFNLGKISLPEPGWSPIPLEQLWGPNGRNLVDEFVNDQLLLPDEVGMRLKASGVARPYSDPLLNDQRVYGDLLKRLYSSGLIDFSLETAVEEVAVFAVSKKNDKQRMILDCRRANCHFSNPAYVSLCTGDTLGRLEIQQGEVMTVGMADLKDAFYHLQLPEPLRSRFCLKQIEAWRVGIEEIHGRPVKRHWKLTPRLSVVPMGWSWALWWCQKIHERLVLRSGLDDVSRLQDRKPVADAACLHLQYVDNLVVLGTNATKVESSFRAAVDELKSVGLQVHEVELGDDGAQVLGWNIGADGTFGPTRKRFWRIRLAIRGMLVRGRATSKQMERLLGHCCFLALARRESLSVFGQAYSFVRRFTGQNDEKPLWPSVRKEFELFDGILPLIQKDLSAPWSEKIHAVDASEWGLGCTSSTLHVDQVRTLGSFCERWRFKDPTSSRARAAAFDEDVGVGSILPEEFDPGDVVLADSHSSFEGVPFGAVDRSWTVVGRHKWIKSGSMPVNEARATLYALKHILRGVDGFGKRHLILSDAMTSTCAFSRGRAQSYQLRRVCQQFGALTLLTGAQAVVRWIPSEWNPSDSPSRGGWSPSVPQRVTADGAAQNGAAEQPLAVVQHSQGPEACDESCNDKEDGDNGGTGAKLGQCGHGPGVDCHDEKVKTNSATATSGSSRPAQRWPISLAAGLNLEADLQQVQATLGPSEASRDDQGWKDEEGGDHRSTVVATSGGEVSGWRRHQLRELQHCGRHTLQPQPEVASHGEVADVQAVVERVEKPLPHSQPTSSALGSDSSVGAGLPQPWEDSAGSPHVDDVHALPSSFGGFACESQRCHPAGEARCCGLPALECGSSPFGAREAIKDKGVRRELDARFGLPRWDRQGDGHEKTTVAGRPVDVAAQKRRSHGLSPRSAKQAQTGAGGSDTPISVPTRRRFIRLCQPKEGSGGDSTAWPMVVTGKCETISKGSTPHSDLRGSRRCHTATVHPGRKQPGKVACFAALSIPGSLQEQVFIEIFSGSGNLGRAIARGYSLPVLLWDITLGEAYDLRSPHNRSKILGWVRCQRVKGGHLGTPCSSFSRARDNPPGPPPLRSNLHVLGLPDLRPADQVKVDEGNLFMKFSVAVLKLGCQLHIPMTMENPRSSRLWLCPQVQQLIRRKFVTQTTVEFCMFGTPWRKSTTFLAVHVSLELLQPFRCIGSKRGICKHSGRSHLALAGQNAKGQWLTKIAEPYPNKLCQKIAQCFSNFYFQERADLFSSALAS